MDGTTMHDLVCRHLRAEGRADVDGAIAVYTDDIEHDVVGYPGSPHYGKGGAREFYEERTANFRAEGEKVLHRYITDDAMILEQVMTGTVIGALLGLPGYGRRISFRILHVFEFRDELISRENIWLDTPAIVEQLS
jgi:steroid delta-isomerase-like uncharacterized protein